MSPGIAVAIILTASVAVLVYAAFVALPTVVEVLTKGLLIRFRKGR